MSEEKLYAVMDDEGLLLLYSEQGAPLWRVWGEMFADKPAAERAAHAENGHVVTFVEEPKKVVVSAEEAEMLKRAKDTTIWRPASVIAGYAYEAERDSSDAEVLLEDRLMRAYVNGWTVEKPKRYNVKVPHTDDSYFYKIDHEICNAADSFHIDLDRPEAKFTKLEIDHYHLQDFKKEEVTDDEQ